MSSDLKWSVLFKKAETQKELSYEKIHTKRNDFKKQIQGLLRKMEQ